jgi:hypothetical protein
MSRRNGGNAVAHNQYCKIIQWIGHHKDHGDPKYAEAVSDLCLDSWLSPSRYPGLTFLYQTNKKIRKEFGEKVFTKESRDACEEFKRYIIPDIFESCEDFQKKDVGNVLGYKYDVKSCDRHKVVFENGMEIHPLLSHNSYEPLNPKLKDIIRIYYVVKGEPDESGDPYKIPRSMHRNNRSSGRVVGGGIELVGELLQYKWHESNFTQILLGVINIGFAYDALSEVLSYLIAKSPTDETIIIAINNLIKGQTYIYSTPVGIIAYTFYTMLLALLIPDDIPGSKEIFTDVLSIIFKHISNHNISLSSTDILQRRSAYVQKLNDACKDRFTTSITPLSEAGAEKIYGFSEAVSHAASHDASHDESHAASHAASYSDGIPSHGEVVDGGLAYGGNPSILRGDQSYLINQMFSLLYNGSLWVLNLKIDKLGNYEGSIIAETLFTLNIAAHEIYLNDKDSSKHKFKFRARDIASMNILIKLFQEMLAEIRADHSHIFSINKLNRLVNLLSYNSRVLILVMGHSTACENFINTFWPSDAVNGGIGNHTEKILNNFTKRGGNIMNTIKRVGGTCGGMSKYF